MSISRWHRKIDKRNKMAAYYYAYSGHKYGLDRVRRAVALIKALRAEGIGINLLVNDFRAGLAAKEFGVSDSVTVETILDVDAVAKRGDTVFVDSPEDDGGKLELYCAEFASLFYVTDACDYQSRYGEFVMKPFCRDSSGCIETPLIDSEYFDILPKEDRTLFFFGDADYDKKVLFHTDFFKGEGMEILLGHYFFVKYEDDLAKIFDTLHEPEEYNELVRTSSRVVTASAQCAMEARAAEADVIYIKKESDSHCLMEKFSACSIKIIDGFDKKAFDKMMNIRVKENKKVTDRMHMIISELIQTLNL
jgi:hypothetical protein